MTKVENVRPEVQKELTEDQKVMVDKAKRIQAILDEAPRSSLMRFLRYSETGIMPDVRIIQVKDDTKPTDETGDREDSSESAEQEPSTESATA